MHLRDAAQGVRVLRIGIISRAGERGAFQQATHARGAIRLAGMRPNGVQTLVEGP